jgi:hypothetical protein
MGDRFTSNYFALFLGGFTATMRLCGRVLFGAGFTTTH